MADANNEIRIVPSWVPLIVAALLVFMAMYLAIWGSGFLETLSLPFGVMLAGLVSQRKSGIVHYSDGETTIRGEGDGVAAAAKLAEKHRHQTVIAKRIYLAASLVIVLLACALAVYGPAGRDLQLLVAEICLFVIALALLGYAINLKLFGLLALKSADKSVSKPK